jgi:murein DD-endopeptidase MepM/ murein hydrolase activator NlpD
MLTPMLARLLLAALLSMPLASAAAPAAAGGIVVAPSVVRPGDAVLVRVEQAPDGPAVSGSTLAGRPLRFWSHGAEAWAVGALPIETPPGQAVIEIGGGEPGQVRASVTVAVVDPGFPSRALHVAPQFVTPPAKLQARIARDRTAFVRAYASVQPGPPLFTASFAWPHPGNHRGRFGDQRTFNGKKESVHYGLDIDAPRGAPVRAANDGEVILARDCYYSGKTVVLWHGADLFTLYFHMDRLNVRAGQQVRQGDRLGVVGSTGRSTGPHLHWSAKVGDMYVDPESLMAIDFVSGTAPPRRAGPPADRAGPPPAEPPATAPAAPAPTVTAPPPPEPTSPATPR